MLARVWTRVLANDFHVVSVCPVEGNGFLPLTAVAEGEAATHTPRPAVTRCRAEMITY